MTKRIWIYVTDDKYEFPLVIAESGYELDRKANKSKGWAHRSLWEQKYLGHKGRVRVVDDMEED